MRLQGARNNGATSTKTLLRSSPKITILVSHSITLLHPNPKTIQVKPFLQMWVSFRCKL